MLPPLHTIADADAYNQQSLQRLLRTFRLSQGDFSLMLAHCNYQELQNHIVATIEAQGSYQILKITLESFERTLFTPIQREWQQCSQPPDVIMVSGLNQLNSLDRVLKVTNQIRDEFRKQFSCPLVLWVNNDVLRQLIRLAPDFQSWATTMDFQLSTNQLVKELEDGDRALFTNLLQIGGGQFVPNSRLFGGRYRRRELDAAVQDLQQRQHPISASLSASLTFVAGREAYETAAQQRDLDQALVHYQRAIAHYETSLEFWQQEPDLKRQGCVFYHLGIAWVARGERYRAEHYVCYQTALAHFWRCINTFVQMERPDYEARFINVLCFTLQRLNQRPQNVQPQWDDLERWAERSLYLQQQYHDQFRLARAYSFLSEVAIAREQWEQAKELATTALVILAAELNNPEAGMASGTRVNLKWERSFHQGWYLLALAQANLKLGKMEAALSNLQTAQQETEIDYDPDLYIRILNQLRCIYFEQKKDYPTAFKIRQQRRLVEYQYNFRAFVGAGHLQPKHQIANPAITTYFREHPTENTDYFLPSDFQASGRQEDIERLVQRIASTNYRFTVIHGQSGVGKSSILEAGLLPILQQNPVGNRSVIPIFQQVYPEWAEGLLQALQASLRQFHQQQSPEFDLYTPDLEQVGRLVGGGMVGSGMVGSGMVGSEERLGLILRTILAQLQWHSRQNMVTVLLFDQFEEFFFSYKNRRDRQQLYQFIKDSLDIPFVNIMISIREDYLHQLLEITRCLTLDVINNDILSRETLYHIGNFSPQRATTVIRTLAAKTPFQLDDDLIDRLVADLSAETGVVSPIELQIVGSQLQTEEITSLAEYEQKGPMEQLVRRYLDEAVTNCGPEHQQMAEYLLYSLTDEQQLRPLRTLTELADDCGAAPDQ
ncbi:MAG: ATP-binding protein, partial [Leptolyngbyaceae bacterium]|nr:ATP-binding protein [Leptolyngbyaceae bacterium]